jgi:hypothetical protein
VLEYVGWFFDLVRWDNSFFEKDFGLQGAQDKDRFGTVKAPKRFITGVR